MVMVNNRICAKHRRELVKSFLFLRTAIAAVNSLAAMVSATKSHITHARSRYAYGSWHAYARQIELQKTLEQEESDLETWRRRLLEAQIGLLSWLSTCTIGFALPMEILQIIRVQLASEG